MTADNLLADLERRGIRLQKVGDRLQVNAPQSGWDNELRAQVIEHKAALLQRLTQDAEPEAETLAATSRRAVILVLLLIGAVVLIVSLVQAQQPPADGPPGPSIDPWTQYQGWS